MTLLHGYIFQDRPFEGRLHKGSLRDFLEIAIHALLQQSLTHTDFYLTKTAADAKEVSLKLCERVCRCLDKLYQLSEALWVFC